MALDTIQPNRLNLGGSYDFTGVLTKNSVDIATVDSLVTGPTGYTGNY